MKKLLAFALLLLSTSAFSNDPIDKAFASDDLDQFVKLAENKISVDYLTHAISAKASNIFHYILKQNVDVNGYDSNGNTPLLAACEANNYEFAEALTNKKADPNLAGKSDLEATPLMYAAAFNNVKLLELLSDNGADINQLDVNKDHALNWATYYGHLQAMEFLIKRGADLKLSSKHGKAVDVGFRLWHADSVAAVFRQHMDLDKIDKKSAALINAIREDNAEEVSKLIKKSANANAKDELGTPAINFAIENGSKEIIASLIAAGADVNALNRVGQASITWAARYGKADILKLLLDNGADPNATDKKYRLTPLIGAAVNGDIEIAEMLLQAGADINVTDSVNGCTPLHWAMFYRHSDFAVAMVNNGADFKRSVLNDTYTGKTLAAAYKDSKILKAIEQVENAENPLFGSWKMYEVNYVYADTTYTAKMEYPGRLIVGNNTYSIMYNPYGSNRKSAETLSKLTEEEMVYAFKTVVFNSGSYEIADSVFLTTADIAKVAGFESGKQYYKIEFEDDALHLTMFDETYPDGKKPEWYGKLKILFKLKREW
ncbi:ankyrin repeat domain-containing protein [Fulvivirga lutimaris]|uniref:ankyrin repeat domain-containing protein n=1 Tax=Fulvivirga lutimaris TaxID=1819566 RepID=UPI0012BBD254|nr:ankyrin repeat domain-containing protein [Fulvivirga lutimaris]MTI39015.1 ankyrin repeat domain-containing protein [Fulvivirga lutimaris]